MPHILRLHTHTHHHTTTIPSSSLLTILFILQTIITQPHSLSSSSPSPYSQPPLPNKSHSPLDIVQFQLSALKNDDMYTVFKYASPSNKANTGPWQRFAQMVKSEPFGVLVGHRRAEVLLEWGGRSGRKEPYGCMVRVWTETANREVCADFNWMLSQCDERDDPLFRGCWMVDGVLPRE